MGDDTSCPNSHNSWLEYGPRLSPRSSVHLHPDVTLALRLLPSLPSRGGVLLSPFTSSTQSHPPLSAGLWHRKLDDSRLGID
eukprot:4861257-Prymnesium_polylepis.1